MINIVLVEPEIPQNTGNIARTCAATGSRLHIVHPIMFDMSDKAAKRAGLDYWHLVDIVHYDSLDDFFEKTKGGRYYFASTKAPNRYSDVSYKDGDYILFGKETKGLPEELLRRNMESCVRIPMIDEARSLNLSNSAAVILYEALRQNNFENLKTQGEPVGFKWEER